MHTPITAAAVFGGVGMGPQEHAFRSGVDVIVATPGRLLDHLRQPYAKLDRIEHLVLDEADRMLDMGFLPDIRRVLKHLPAKRQTLFFSATMPAPIVELTREMLHNPATINLERKAAPAVGITQAVYPVPQELKSIAAAHAARARRSCGGARLHAHEASRQSRCGSFSTKRGINAARIHGNRSQAQRTDALAGFKSGELPRARRHRHRRARHRRRSARPRRQLRRAGAAGGLHPSRRPHGARRDDGRGVHVRVARRRRTICGRSSARSARRCRA